MIGDTTTTNTAQAIGGWDRWDGNGKYSPGRAARATLLLTCAFLALVGTRVLALCLRVGVGVVGKSLWKEFA